MATSTIALERPVSSTPAPGRGTMGRLARQRGAIVGLMVLGTLVVLAVGAPLLNSRDPIKTSVRDALQPPGPRFVLGSDQFGRDVASRVLHGTRISLTVGRTAILSAAALSFLGLGSQPPLPEWGRMLSEGRDYLREAWWISTFPGLAIMVTVLAMNLLGDALRDVLDPRLKT